MRRGYGFTAIVSAAHRNCGRVIAGVRFVVRLEAATKILGATKCTTGRCAANTRCT